MPKEGTPTLSFDVVQHREGADLRVRGCIENSCTDLDKTSWDRENRPQAVEVRDMMKKIDGNDYLKQTCKRFGGTLTGGKCVVKKGKKGKKSARATTKKK